MSPWLRFIRSLTVQCSLLVKGECCGKVTTLLQNINKLVTKILRRLTIYNIWCICLHFRCCENTLIALIMVILNVMWRMIDGFIVNLRQYERFYKLVPALSVVYVAGGTHSAVDSAVFQRELADKHYRSGAAHRRAQCHDRGGDRYAGLLS